MLYLRGKYGVGQELFFAPGVVIMSEDKAAFISVQGNDRGVTFTEGSECFGSPFHVLVLIALGKGWGRLATVWIWNLLASDRTCSADSSNC